MDISTLNGAEYQKLVFEGLLCKLFADPTVLTVKNYDQGPVDYVVNEPPGSGMLGTNKMHYFECKNYSRTLELDNVAKIMVVAVADQPASVHVVSRTRLQPQITTYASRLFDVGIAGSPIFRSIVFRHWQTDRLLNFIKTDFGEEGQAAENEGSLRVSWWITACSSFSETEIASSDAPSRQITVRRGGLLLLTLELPTDEVGRVELVGFPDSSWAPVVSNDNGGTTTRRSYLIDTAHLTAGEIYLASVKVVRGVTDIRIPLGQFHVGASEAFLPELRPEEVERLARQIGPSGEYRLVLVDGEAGAGKTYLIEKVSEELRAKAGFDVMCFTITEENSENLMGALLRGCLTPPINRNSFREVANAVHRALLPEDAEERTLETNISLLARVATRMGPRVIVLRDCQHLTDQVANQLWTLIVALDDASWGGLRFVLEYRQPEAQLNLALRSLVEKINLKIRKSLLKKSVLPLNEKQFYSVIGEIFVHITEEITQCFMQRTGGLPLFIDAYLRRLLDRGLIGRNSSGKSLFAISHPAQVLADTLPVNGQLILEERIRTWLHQKFGNDMDSLAVELGLLAIAEDSSGQFFIREALQLSHDRLRAIQVGLDEGGLGYGRPDGQVVFRHDLFRVAMISVAKATPTFTARAKEAAERLLQRIVTVNEVQIRYIRTKMFDLIGDRVALEVELRLGIRVAQGVSDFGRLVYFLSQLLDLLKERSNVEERLDLMNSLAWAAWVSDSLLVAREYYLQLAEESERSASGEFSIAEATATDAYRRAIGIDLELMEPIVFLQNAISVLKRRQTYVTFNSIVNRLVLFCARFGYPGTGYRFLELAFNYIGDGARENEGAVLYSEAGALYAPSEPETALWLFEQGTKLAMDECQRSYNLLDTLILETLHQGQELDPESFGLLWRTCSQKRFSEILTRASLLRGSLFLRQGDFRNAHHWISRTATMVRLYHLKEFQLAILNDLLLLAMLQGDYDAARGHLADLADELDLIFDQREAMSSLVERAYEECRNAATKLSADPSGLRRPSLPPEHCDPFCEMLQNVAAISTNLGVNEIAGKYSSRSTLLESGTVRNMHRYMRIGDLELVLGAY
ncbi:MAG TPA: AAA family ATPase [Stellaceae bacterium]|nr:AAA family ATPase [Stellaceae bacterium]